MWSLIKKISLLLLIFLSFFSKNLSSEQKSIIETEEEIKKIYQSIVRIDSIVPSDARTANSLGTERNGNGVIIDENNILTIGYIVLESEKIDVTLFDGRVIPAKVAAHDYTTGFGIITPIIKTKLNHLPLGNSDNLSKEDFAFVLPFPNQGRGSAVKIVSRRPFSGWWEYYLENPIYTYPINYSWAGSPLINRQGEILGIGSLSVGETTPGIASLGNMFVPINSLKDILSDLKKHGKRTRDIKPYFGLSLEDSTGKVSILRVSKNGPAEKVGILPDDIISSINGKKISSLEDFYKTSWSFGGPGTEIKLDIERQNENLSFKIKTGDRSDYYVKPKYF